MHICMDWNSVSYDWNQVRAFLVTAEEGSFSAASRALGLTQPTVGRQVSALEQRLGVTLFERVGRSLSMSQSGLELLEHVRAMGDAASRISLTASGQSQKIEGHVIITATDVLSVYLLPEALKQLRKQAPGIEIELVASNDVRDLRRREADIAIRHARPDQPDLIAKLLRETPAYLCASTDYLDTHGRPKTTDDLADAVFVGFDQSDQLLTHLKDIGLPVTKNNFKLASQNGAVAWELVKQGFGIGVMIHDVVARTPGIERILPDLHVAQVPIWLVTHRELHTSRRIRLVYDVLAEVLKK